MSIKQDQYTVIDYTLREAVVIKTKAGVVINEKHRNTRLSAPVSLTCWLPLALTSVLIAVETVTSFYLSTRRPLLHRLSGAQVRSRANNEKLVLMWQMTSATFCLNKLRESELSVGASKHNVETSHVQCLKQQWRVQIDFATFIKDS